MKTKNTQTPIQTGKGSPAPRKSADAALSREPWADAIRAACPPADFIKLWGSAAHDTARYEAAFLTSEQVPSVRYILALGAETFRTAMEIAAMKLLVIGCTEKDVSLIAAGITGDEDLRMLAPASIIRFFHQAMCGKYRFYGPPTGLAVLNAMHEALPSLQEEEGRLRRIRRQRLDDERRARARKEAVTWEQFAASHGIDTDKYDTFFAFYEAVRRGEEQPIADE